MYNPCALFCNSRYNYARFYYYNRIASRNDSPWLSRRVCSNNNDDLLKYASLIIITDNRGGKRGRPLPVKHSFAVEFLTLRISNTSLPPSPSIVANYHPAEKRRAIPQDTRRESELCFCLTAQIQRRKFSTLFHHVIYQSVKFLKRTKKIAERTNVSRYFSLSLSRTWWRTVLILALCQSEKRWITTYARTRRNGKKGCVQREPKEENVTGCGTGNEWRELNGAGEIKKEISAYFEAGLIEITVNHV